MDKIQDMELLIKMFENWRKLVNIGENDKDDFCLFVSYPFIN